jgi:uncharacterized RDD family membrane protein YckC
MMNITPQPVEQPYGGYLPRMPYGGFWRRLLAYIIDGIILGIVIGALETVITAIFHPGSSTNGSLPASATAGWSLFSFVITWLYFAVMESSSYQATIGKLILGMRVTDVDGQRISFARATGRWFAKILSTLILWIGYLMIAFTPRKRGLHDYIAGTLVYKSWALQGAAATPSVPAV